MPQVGRFRPALDSLTAGSPVHFPVLARVSAIIGALEEAMKQPVERRLAAILAADVAGYSRLMGLDEAGTAQALREHRAAADPLIAQHGGRIVKTTGDGC